MAAPFEDAPAAGQHPGGRDHPGGRTGAPAPDDPRTEPCEASGPHPKLLTATPMRGRRTRTAQPFDVGPVRGADPIGWERVQSPDSNDRSRRNASPAAADARWGRVGDLGVR